MFGNPKHKKNPKNRRPSNSEQKSSKNDKPKFPQTSVNPDFIKACFDARTAGSNNPPQTIRLTQVAGSLAYGYTEERNKSGTVAVGYTNNNKVVIGRSHSLYQGKKPETRAPSKYNVKQQGRSPQNCGEPKVIDRADDRESKITETVAVYRNHKKPNGIMIERCPNCKQYQCLGHVYTDHLNGKIVPSVTKEEKARGQPHLRPILTTISEVASTSSSLYSPSSGTPRNTYHGSRAIEQKAKSTSAQYNPMDVTLGDRRYSIGTTRGFVKEETPFVRRTRSNNRN
ncbi:18121_t:CDS:1 [Acaulospora morrowiae]|uniref:18121_t:CDS:1 n=1 Tax=Acaulospora morrowiae TaxID=94023 RepID=A0A9N9DMM0_9GLOM|nr:18121_t:CDS:1 [Acaulospora morrowiae]